MASINPFIYFKGNCKEAMTFYQAILGGELQLLTGGETLTGICHPEMRDLIFYSRISVGQTFLIAVDISSPEKFSKGNDMAVSLNCDDEVEIKTIFLKLSKKGNVIVDLTTSIQGHIYGVVEDRFTVKRLLNYQKVR